MYRRHLVVSTLAALVLCQWPGRAIGQQMITACAADREKLCPDIRIGGGRVVACLHEHQAQLSDTCKQALGGAAGSDARKAACREDATKFCHPAIGDQVKMKACMQEHAAQLSDGCKTALIAQGK